MTPAEVEGFIEYLSDTFWHQDVPPGTWDQWRATVRSLSLAEAVAAVEIVKREHEFLSFHVWAEAIEVVRVEAARVERSAQWRRSDAPALEQGLEPIKTRAEFLSKAAAALAAGAAKRSPLVAPLADAVLPPGAPRPALVKPDEPTVAVPQLPAEPPPPKPPWDRPDEAYFAALEAKRLPPKPPPKAKAPPKAQSRTRAATRARTPRPTA